MKKIIIPARYLKIAKQKGTRATRNVRTGQFTGRVVVQGDGDKTKERHVAKNIDVDKDGKIDFYGGQLVGRTPAGNYRIKASNKSRGHIRRARQL